MGIPNTNVPGVYSTLDASRAVGIMPGTSKVIGLAANVAQGEKGVKYLITSYADAVAAFGEDNEFTNVIDLCRIAFMNGARVIVVVPAAIATDETTKATVADYQDALDQLGTEEVVKIVLVDSEDEAIFTKVKEHVNTISEDKKERIAVVGGKKQTVTEACTAARAINSNRVVYVDPAPIADNGVDEIPGFFMAAAVAAQISTTTDPALPYNGVELVGFGGLTAKRTNIELDLLITAGITPIESQNGAISIVRAVTTKTKEGSADDITWQELTTTLIADDVISDIRTALATKFRRTKNSERIRSSIKTDCKVMLGVKVENEIINSYTEPTVTQIKGTIDKVVVDFLFSPIGPLNQIHIKAHMII